MNDHEEKEYRYTALAIKTVEDTTSYDQVQVNVGSLSFPFTTESLSIYGTYVYGITDRLLSSKESFQINSQINEDVYTLPLSRLNPKKQVLFYIHHFGCVLFLCNECHSSLSLPILKRLFETSIFDEKGSRLKDPLSYSMIIRMDEMLTDYYHCCQAESVLYELKEGRGPQPVRTEPQSMDPSGSSTNEEKDLEEDPYRAAMLAFVNYQKNFATWKEEKEEEETLRTTIKTSQFTYTGETREGRIEGAGIMLFTGEMSKRLKTYRGDFKNNVFHGNGELLFSDNSYYEGHFENGFFDGLGQMMAANGDNYMGPFKEGRKEGIGILMSSTGLRYEGEFYHNQFHGFGICLDESGRKYEGMYKHGKRNGVGNLYYGTMLKYSGSFHDDEMEGFGEWYATDKKCNQSVLRYRGHFVKSMKDGEGVYFFENGSVFVGTFRQNEINGFGKRYILDGSVLEGHWTENQLNGYGCFCTNDGSIYDGEYKDTRQQGYGLFLFSDRNVCSSVWNDNIIDGYTTFYVNGNYVYHGEMRGFVRRGIGEIQYENGIHYIGEWESNRMNGRGEYKTRDGDHYIGQFKDGKRTGRGVFHFSDGSVYDGEYVEDKRSGQGTMTYNDGSIYSGSWDNDNKNGYGKIQFFDGGSYVGYWKNDKANGFGKMVFLDHSYYEGEYIDNKRNGRGEYVYTDGSKYVGSFKNGVFHGAGIYNSSNGDFFKGTFKNNVFVEGYKSFHDGRQFYGNCLEDKKEFGLMIYPNQDIYYGELKSFEKDGIGILKTKEYLYKGTFKENKKDGEGKMYYQNHDSYEGSFEEDHYNGVGIFYDHEDSLFIGVYQKDVKEGGGTIVKNKNEFYMGMYEKDQKSGYGLERNGAEQYFGCYQNGMKSGFGIYESEQLKIPSWWSEDNIQEMTDPMEKEVNLFANYDSVEGALFNMIEAVVLTSENEEKSQSEDQRDVLFSNYKNLYERFNVLTEMIQTIDLDTKKEYSLHIYSKEYSQLIGLLVSTFQQCSDLDGAIDETIKWLNDYKEKIKSENADSQQ